MEIRKHISKESPTRGQINLWNLASFSSGLSLQKSMKQFAQFWLLHSLVFYFIMEILYYLVYIFNINLSILIGG